MFIPSNSSEVTSFLAFLDNGITKLLLVHFSQIHHLLNGPLTDQAEHLDITALTYSEHTILRLLINSRIPTGIKENNSICTSNVQTSSSTLLGNQKYKYSWYRIKLVHHFYAIFNSSLTIQP